MAISCIVLAGGRSLRLGRNKFSEYIGGSNLLQRVIDCLSDWNEIIVVIAPGQSLPQLDSNQRLKIVTDIHPGKGPLGGIYTGLITSDSFHNIVVAGDMPFLNGALLRYITGLSANFDCVVPSLGGVLEPLHAVYARTCLAPIESMLSQDMLSVLQLFPRVKVNYIAAGEIERFDPDHLSFFNINTEADLSRARELARQAQASDHLYTRL
ncbi:MAG: molybdenum cofactor guanylyltransferase [Chloroflexi bacterium]|nr:molybdenum cofactor guanylyltransferase [Chloroflexota bacterium]